MQERQIRGLLALAEFFRWRFQQGSVERLIVLARHTLALKHLIVSAAKPVVQEWRFKRCLSCRGGCCHECSDPSCKRSERFVQLTAKTAKTYRTGDSMGKLQRRPIEIFNRADSFSECTLQPSCVTIESNIATAPWLKAKPLVMRTD